MLIYARKLRERIVIRHQESAGHLVLRVDSIYKGTVRLRLRWHTGVQRAGRIRLITLKPEDVVELPTTSGATVRICLFPPVSSGKARLGFDAPPNIEVRRAEKASAIA